jgi:hypothetical protein
MGNACMAVERGRIWKEKAVSRVEFLVKLCKIIK